MEFDLIPEMVREASLARREMEGSSQDRLDGLVRAIGRTIFDNAEVLSRLVVDETGMGNCADKAEDIREKSRNLWNSLKGRKSTGIISEDRGHGVIKIAKPMGVVGAVVSCADPVTSLMCTAMFAVKAGNSVIIDPHSRTKSCAAFTVELIRTALRTLDAPVNLIQSVEEPSTLKSSELMSLVDVIVATGGKDVLGMAYSSGKPAYGGGFGNVQCILDRDIDLEKAVEMIAAGRAFDNGIISSGEQMMIVHNDDFLKAVENLEKNNAYVIRDSVEASRLREILIDEEGQAFRDTPGISAWTLAERSGLKADRSVTLIAVEADGSEETEYLQKRRLFPVLGIRRCTSFEDAVDIASENLAVDGTGHTAVIHSDNEDNIRYAAEQLKVCSLLVNQVAATMAGGSFMNGLAPATVQGCGTWGNSILSGNFSYSHLLNLTTVSLPAENQYPPSDEELWE